MKNLFEQMARTMALIGGVVLTSLIILVSVSVLGRGLNTLFHSGLGTALPGLSEWALSLGVGPITGDFELVEAGIAFAIFCFLPWCQLRAGHATVDIFVERFPKKLQRVLVLITDIVFAIVLVVIANQLFEGMSSKMRYGETTFLLQFPIWWAYAASFSGAIVAAIMGIYVALLRCAELWLGRDLVQSGEGAGH